MILALFEQLNKTETKTISKNLFAKLFNH
jgi:hypothetical protein